MAFNTYINTRLNQWAQWTLQRTSGGLGYPRECSYTRMMARSSAGFMSPGMDEEAWLVEKAVQDLPDYLKETVQVFYIGKGTVEQKARDLHCSRDTVYSRIERAHGQIMDWLNADACKIHA